MKLPPQLQDGGVALLLGRDTAPGDDPHQIKGLAYRGHLDFVAEEIEGGLKGHLQAIDKLPMTHVAAMHEFFEATFFASSMYDVYPLAIAGIACSRITGESFLDFVTRRTEMQVSKDIRGVHKFLIKIVSAKMVASRLPRMLTQYMNFSKVEISRPDPSRVHGVFTEIPLALGAWFLAAVETYMRTVLIIAGATDARVEGEAIIEDDQQRVRVNLDVIFPS